jgi:hypothetical protein
VQGIDRQQKVEKTTPYKLVVQGIDRQQKVEKTTPYKLVVQGIDRQEKMEKTTPYKLDHKSEVIYCIGFKKWFNFHG